MDKNIRKSDILTIVKEDILRILGEEEDIVSLDSIRDELKVLDAYISNAVKSLENENLILVKDNFIKLTQSGEVKAKEIWKIISKKLKVVQKLMKSVIFLNIIFQKK
jgi:Mn-dependent DtxR family transcriptional regulator